MQFTENKNIGYNIIVSQQTLISCKPNIRNKGEADVIRLNPPVKCFNWPFQGDAFGSFFVIMFHVCHAVMSVSCSLVVACWERANLLVLLYSMFSCVFVTFPCGVLG